MFLYGNNQRVMDLDLTRIFVKVIQNGSFSRAADLLQLPKSTVSKSITRLEKETGTKLILRTTRSLSLTSAGRVFYETSLGPIQTLEDAQKSLYGGDNLLSGLLRITAPEDLGTHVVAPAIADLTLKYPNLSFELQYTDRVIDLVKDGFDIAVRIGRINESSFKVKRAGDFSLVLVASPKYINANQKLKHPKDLQNHNCLTYSNQAYHRWNLRSAKGSVQVPLKIRVSSNQMTSLMRVAKEGAGIALIPQYLCQKDFDSGRLVHVLPEWSSKALAVSIITPLAPTSSARLKMTVDSIMAALQEAIG